MPDPFTLDQLRALALVAEEGSFSGAARKLNRVQSAVSQAMSLLEEHLGVPLWDRAARRPTLTPAGQSVLAHARRVLGEADGLRRLVDGMSQGLEAQVHLCVDSLFPLPSLAALCAAFMREHPTVDLRVDTQTMSGVSARVLDGRATLGVVSEMGMVTGLESRRLAAIHMIPVAAPKHPLAAHKGTIARARFEDAIQIVLAEREVDGGVPDQGVLSSRTWRITELFTKRALLCAGLGWGNLPEHLVRDDLRRGKLVRLRPEGWRDDEHTLTLYAVHRTETRLGPAHRSLLSHLQALCTEAIGDEPARAPAPRRRGKGR